VLKRHGTRNTVRLFVAPILLWSVMLRARRRDHRLAQCVPEFRNAERGINAG
jgi:hypothetical protein